MKVDEIGYASEKSAIEKEPGFRLFRERLLSRCAVQRRRFARCITVDPCDFAVLTNEKLHKLLAEHHAWGNKFLLMLLSVTVQTPRSV